LHTKKWLQRRAERSAEGAFEEATLAKKVVISIPLPRLLDGSHPDPFAPKPVVEWERFAPAPVDG
jgi:hypothetical protein